VKQGPRLVFSFLTVKWAAEYQGFWTGAENSREQETRRYPVTGLVHQYRHRGSGPVIQWTGYFRWRFQIRMDFKLATLRSGPAVLSCGISRQVTHRRSVLSWRCHDGRTVTRLCLQQGWVNSLANGRGSVWATHNNVNSWLGRSPLASATIGPIDVFPTDKALSRPHASCRPEEFTIPCWKESLLTVRHHGTARETKPSVGSLVLEIPTAELPLT